MAVAASDARLSDSFISNHEHFRSQEQVDLQLRLLVLGLFFGAGEVCPPATVLTLGLLFVEVVLLLLDEVFPFILLLSEDRQLLLIETN